MTINGRRFLAWTVMAAAGVVLAVIGVLAARADRYTPVEAAASAIAFLTGVVAALWLRRDKRKYGGRHRS